MRENSCIDGDDDIDIICDFNNYNDIKQMLTDNGFLIQIDCIGRKKRILKTSVSDEYSSIDLYLATVKKGNFYDSWEKVTWTNCYINNKLIEYQWKDEILYLPNNYEQKLINRYGDDWKIPAKSKGVQPVKTSL